MASLTDQQLALLSSGLTDQQATTVNLHVDLKQQRLRVDWQDGVHSEYDLGLLPPDMSLCDVSDRRSKPPSSLPILQRSGGTPPPQVIDAQLVGHYAIQLMWSDQHDTGIYEYRYLRAAAEAMRQAIDREQCDDT